MASQGKGGYCRFCLNFQAAQVHHIIKNFTRNELWPDLNLQRRLARLWAVCWSPLQFHTQWQYLHEAAQADGKNDSLPPRISPPSPRGRSERKVKMLRSSPVL